MPKKIILPVILVLSLSLLLSSCSFITINKPGAGEEERRDAAAENTIKYISSKDYTPTAKEKLSGVKKVNIERNVTIACPDASYIFPEEITDRFDEAKITRNRLFKEYFGGEITAIETPIDEMIAAIKTAQAQKHNYADLLMIPVNRLAEFIAAGVLANMKSLPYTDFSSDVYYPSVVGATSYGEQVYAVCGDGCFDPSHLYMLYYNKTALSAAGIGDITKTAEEKKLTWDYILTCAQKARESGFTGSALSGRGYSTASDAVYLSSGYNYVGHTSSGNVPVVLPFTENGQASLTAVNKILSQYGGYFENDAYAKFVSGSSLFCIAPVSALSEINRKELDFGVLPMPLAYEGAPQSSFIDDRTYVICLPVTANDISLSGAALQGFMAASYGYMNEDYYSYLILHLIRSSRDLDMIDIARGGCGNPAVNYDFSLVFENAPVNSATRNLASEAVFYGGIITDNYRQREYAANRSLYDLYK